MTLPLIKDKYLKAVAYRSLLIDSLQTNVKVVEENKALQQEIDKAQALCQKVARETQEQVKFNLEDIVNLALDAVFPDMYDFQIIFEIKRGKTEARMVVLEQGAEIDVLDSTGGGLADILSFALRVALLMLSRNDKVLILDEPFKYVSEDKKEQAYAIMQRLSTDLGLQIIAVTHDRFMIDIADKIYKIKKTEGCSYVTE